VSGSSDIKDELVVRPDTIEINSKDIDLLDEEVWGLAQLLCVSEQLQMDTRTTK
jgi:hypothetical protein